ncbi:UNVERIFIED_CONTAM: hypothetical protein PYX00_006409 [Menopon gallinae]|uniref:Radial spoke head 10 homolog B n=1 Tax=Menopon gallinae TaxID=328185 RepID=A0AAW2HV55_9NEOP
MVKCPRGTADQVKANLEHLKSLTCSDSESEEYKISAESYEGNEEIFPYNELDIVRADKRCPPTTEDEITYLFVNHFLDILLKCWEGKPCLKQKIKDPEAWTKTERGKPSKAKSRSEESEEEYSNESTFMNSPSGVSAEYLTKYYAEVTQKVSKESKPKYTKPEPGLSEMCSRVCESLLSFSGETGDYERGSDSTPCWSRVPPDEDVHLAFQNGVSYEGRVSRRLMDGDGKFFWEDGTTYCGEFVGGTATGFGKFEFPNQDIYEGKVYKGFRHGEGLQVMHESPVMYSGEWWMGKKTGQGLVFYDNPMKVLNFYTGSWLDDKKDGFGYRQYPSGSKYVGYWRDGKRHGTGIMFWANNDIYRGEWKNGLMDGYGEYIWRGFINKSFSYPRINAYRGFWSGGKREGIGVLEMSNGGFVGTVWTDNEKNGPGVAICPNGTAVADGEKLFKNDKPALKNEKDEELLGLFFRNQGFFSGRRKNVKKKIPDENQLTGFMSSMEKAKAISIPIHTPVHSLDLTYHVRKLQAQKHDFFKRQTQQIFIFGARNTPRIESFNELKPTAVQEMSQSMEGYSTEEKLLRYSISVNLMRLKKCYEQWATIACREKPTFQCHLLRIFFWDLLTQAQVPQRNFSLIDIDNLFADEIFYVDFLHDPFERIQFWQFLHFLITISWEMYGRYVFLDNVTSSKKLQEFLQSFYNQTEKAVLSEAFNYFLQNHIFIAEDNFTGHSFLRERDLVPLKAMYTAYKKIGEPHSVKDFLIAVYKEQKYDPTQQEERYIEKLKKHQIFGHNAITLTNELSYLPVDEHFNRPQMPMLEKETEELIIKSQLSCFSSLKARQIIKCIIQVCPNIVEEDIIVDTDHQLTFLEFYQSVLLCAEKYLQKLALKAMQSEILENFNQEMMEYEKAMKEYESQKEAAVQPKKTATKKSKK